MLRPFRPGDAVPLATLDARLREVLGDSGPGWHGDTAADPGRAHLVLDDGGDGPAGYLVLAAPRGTEPGVELHRLVVAPDRHGRGLGRALLATACGLAGVPGAGPPGGPPRVSGTLPVEPGWTPPGWLAAGRIWLEVAPGNTAALALYRAAGLTVETRLPSVPGDPGSEPLRLVLSRG